MSEEDKASAREAVAEAAPTEGHKQIEAEADQAAADSVAADEAAEAKE